MKKKKFCEYSPWFIMYRFYSKLVHFSKPIKVTDSYKTLAYYVIWPFSAHYKHIMFFSTGPRWMKTQRACTRKHYGFIMIMFHSKLGYNLFYSTDPRWMKAQRACTIKHYGFIMFRFHSKLEYLYKTVKVTDGNKNISLIHTIIIFHTLQILYVL
jgi:hypothetical protein